MQVKRIDRRTQKILEFVFTPERNVAQKVESFFRYSVFIAFLGYFMYSCVTDDIEFWGIIQMLVGLTICFIVVQRELKRSVEERLKLTPDKLIIIKKSVFQTSTIPFQLSSSIDPVRMDFHGLMPADKYAMHKHDSNHESDGTERYNPMEEGGIDISHGTDVVTIGIATAIWDVVPILLEIEDWSEGKAAMSERSKDFLKRLNASQA